MNLLDGNKIVATINFRSNSVVEEKLSVDANLLTLLDHILVLVCKLVAVEIVPLNTLMVLAGS